MTRRSLTAAALFGFVACLAFASTVSAQISQDEAALVRFIDERSEQSIDLLERLVNINSGSLNLEGVRDVGAILDAELAQIGFDTRWIDFPAPVNRAGHLFAERTGSQGKRLLLIGHLDTVFEEDDAFQTFERRESIGFGPGTDDMKGGDVVMVLALQALASIGALDDTTIRIIFTGDEERPGEPLELVRRDLIEAAKESDAVLGFEGGVRDAQGDWATTARRGSSGWTLRVTGTQAHSSRIFSDEVGAGAIFEAARILNEFYQVVRGEQYLTFNAGMIVGGTHPNDLPESARTRPGRHARGRGAAPAPHRGEHRVRRGISRHGPDGRQPGSARLVQ
jgi:glutamate carboxypeptidase